MKCVTFYLLSQESQKNETNHIEQLVYKLASVQWRSNKSILITCENKYQAEKIDKELWLFDQNTFLPHNLFKNTTCNSPITIYWNQCYYDNKPRDLLINLMKKNISFFFNFNEIIDFVPVTDNLKQWARNRYRYYKKCGFQIHIVNLSSV